MTMSDLEAIQQVINRYTDGCNRQDWPQVMATFAEDGIWEAAGSALTGHATIQAAMAGFLTTVDYFIQSASASVITVAGDRATARTMIRECGKFKGRDEALEILGFYADELVRTSAGWQFAHRKFTTFGAHRFAIFPGMGF
jgi:ketosteroid isomerase-like protein